MFTDADVVTSHSWKLPGKPGLILAYADALSREGSQKGMEVLYLFFDRQLSTRSTAYERLLIRYKILLKENKRHLLYVYIMGTSLNFTVPLINHTVCM